MKIFNFISEKLLSDKNFLTVFTLLLCLPVAAHAHGVGIQNGILEAILLVLFALMTTFVALLGNSIVKKIILFINALIILLLLICLNSYFDTFALPPFIVPIVNIIICVKGSSVFSQVKNGETGAVKKFISKGGNVNLKDKKGIPLLHYSAQAYKNNITELLLANGADINSKDNEGRTIFHVAAKLSVYFDKKTLIEMLIAKGVDINAKDNSGKTPLDYAEKEEIKQLLISHGAKSGKDL